MTILTIDRLDSPLGTLLLVMDEGVVCALDFADYEARMMRGLERRFTTVELLPALVHSDLPDRLRAYFNGDLESLADIPIDPGGTPFQQRVWHRLRSIPVGTVWTYKHLAEQIGQPTACRAVGMANSQNPIAIIVPCHRVIGTNQQLTGYAGGIDRKQWLLDHEGISPRLALGIRPLPLGKC